MNIAAIRQGLAANLSALTGLQVSPYLLSNPSPPYAMIHADETEYDLAMRGGAHALHFVATVVVPYSSEVAAQTALDEYRAGARSVKQELEADRRLGGACEDLRVESAGPDTFYGEGGIGCEFRVYVLAADQ